MAAMMVFVTTAAKGTETAVVDDARGRDHTFQREGLFFAWFPLLPPKSKTLVCFRVDETCAKSDDLGVP